MLHILLYPVFSKYQLLLIISVVLFLITYLKFYLHFTVLKRKGENKKLILLKFYTTNSRVNWQKNAHWNLSRGPRTWFWCTEMNRKRNYKKAKWNTRYASRCLYINMKFTLAFYFFVSFCGCASVMYIHVSLQGEEILRAANDP